jgi:mycothiol synthase
MQNEQDWPFELRPASLQDEDTTCALFDVASFDAIGFCHRDTERVRAFWARRHLGDQGTSAEVAVARSSGAIGEVAPGTIVGAALLNPGEERTQALVVVHPAWRKQGIGGALAGWLATEVTGDRDTARAEAVSLVQRVLAANRDATTLLQARGWQHMRSFLRMERALTDCDVTVQRHVDGVRVRPVVAEHEMDALLLAEHLAFQEDESYDPEQWARLLARRKQLMATYRTFDPGVWFVASLGDTIVGVCLCTPDTVEREDMAWINRLAVRVPWRRQGIGHALLKAAFAELARRGKRHVGLHVIAGNEPALRTYMTMGMFEVPGLRLDEFQLAVRAHRVRRG